MPLITRGSLSVVDGDGKEHTIKGLPRAHIPMRLAMAILGPRVQQRLNKLVAEGKANLSVKPDGTMNYKMMRPG